MSKPIVTNSTKYNINDLQSDRIFEELIHRIFENKLNSDLKNKFDNAKLMPGVAEKGRDVILLYKGKNNGIIQCKMNTSGNLSKVIVAKEIIKFAIYYYQDKTLINDISTFVYYFICSGQFASTTIALLSDFKNNILKEEKFQEWTESVLKGYSAFNGLTYLTVETEIKKILSNLTVEFQNYSEINGWLNDYPKVASEFFDIKKVTDNTSIDKLLNILDPKVEKQSKLFISSYYKSAKSHLNIVKFIGHDINFSRPKNITVPQLYIEPNLEYKKKEKSNGTFNSEKTIKINQIFKRSKHYVILGDPGAGKSLLIKDIILKLIKNNNNLTGGLKMYSNYIPFRIELRKFNAEKLKSNLNIIDYLTLLLQQEYQLNGINKDILLHIINNKESIFFFDGLDEVFDISQKNNIRDDIVNFVSINKKVKCIITSRFVGYQDNSFPEDKFEEFSIQGFDDKRIDKFIDKFYKTQITDNQLRIIESNNCKKQLIDIDQDLKSNPLILSLMALLALNKIIIPESKLDVYRSCTNTLVETRDKQEKELNFNVKVKSIRGTFGKLGYWQYVQMSEKSTINRSLAKNTISKFLVEKNEFDDLLEAEESSENFLKYAESRSIYFDDNFMHKTFLEYYTADYIFTRFHNGLNKLNIRDEIITKYIGNKAWHIIFELLVSMIDENIVESDQLDDLITKHLDKKNNIINTFFLSILPKIVNISIQIQKEIIQNAITSLLYYNIDKEKKVYLNSKDKSLLILLKEISHNNKFKKVFQDSLSCIEKELVLDKDKINFYILFCELKGYRSFNDNQQDKFEYTIFNETIKENLKNKDRTLFFMVEMHKDLTYIKIKEYISEYVKNFGSKFIFEKTPYMYNSATIGIPLFEIYLDNYSFDSPETLNKDIEYFNKHNITIDFIKENYKSEFLIHIIREEEKINSMINIYIENKTSVGDEFLKILFTKIDKRMIKKIIQKLEDNIKLTLLLEELN